MKRAMRRRKTWQRQAAAITAAMMAMSVGGIAYAMPQGEVIRSGKGEITRQDKDMTVNQDSKRLAIDWSGFDIANDERVTFRQPDKDSVALNRVVGDAASVIDGTLSGNGHVYVINPNGVLFGKNASVDVGSLVASTARISDSDMTNFANADGITMAIPEDSSAKVINAGTIRAEGGLVVLHAAEVENSGTITNPEGTTALAAARNLSLSADTAGKINFTVDGALAKAKALNSGVLKADGGYLVMTARSAGDVMSTVVNNTGTMEAKTLRQNEKGEILLDGGDNGIVELNGTLDASGMEAGQSAGSIKAIGAETHVEDGATLHAIGAVDGGLIETSGDYLEIGDNVDIDAAGKTGKAGEWLLDPTKVIISDEGDSNVTGSNRYTRGTTYLKTSSITNVLKKNNVKIQATDSTYHNADISLDSALNVDETTAGKNTLTLEAEENININADINATAALNVVLNADTNRDDKGGVNINADIRTGGGSLTTGANGATFFGGTNSGENNRVIETSGGNVNIQNEARLQLNGGTLFINTAGGNVTFARNVASMNKYEAFMDHDFVAGLRTDQATAWEHMLKLVYGKSYTNDRGQSVRFIVDGQRDYESLNHDQKIKASNMLAQTWEFADIAAKLNNIEDPDGKKLNGQHLVTITDKYENSAAMANAVKKTGNVVEYFTGGKDVTGRTGEAAYMTDGRTFAWVTGPEAGTAFYETTGEGRGYELNGNYTNWVRNEPIDPSRPWNGSYNEPNNNRGREHQPYVAIGWTDQNGWDDVGNGAGTVHGFIRETELPNSALSINSGAGKVTVGTEGVADTGRLGSGEGTGLRNLSIETTTGNVKVLGSIYVHDNNANAAADLANGNVNIATQGNVDVGQITADKKVEIATTGADKDVTVNGKIATDGIVSIEATDDITVHGIENGDTIRLISTNPNGDGAITLAYNAEGGGALITKSKANDAVIIDVQGKNGSFQNLTSKDVPAITTGTGGNWKVYSYSPDADTFGTNLNSGTNAQWGATSTSYSASENDGDKYIFQAKPTVYVTANDMTKVYGEELTNANVTTTAEATFTGQDNKEHNVNAYTDAFTEGDVSDYYNGSGTFTSEGWAKTATRTGGDKAPASEPENNAIYNIKATSDSYNLTDLGKTSGYADATTKDGGTVEILRRQINVNGSGSQTYGNATINDWKLTASLTGNQEGVPSGADAIVNDDKLDESTGNLSIKSDSSYAENQAGHTTADANPNSYEDAVNMENIGFENGAGVNYEIVKAQGDLKVNKANLTITTNGFEKVYGDVEGVQNALKNAVTVTGLTNGDNNGESMITVDGTSEALIDVDGEIRTNNVKDGGYDIDAVLTTDLQNTIHTNYNVTPGTGKAVLTKKGITLITDDIKTTYGDGNTIRDKVNNDLLHLEGLVSWDKESDVFAEITPGVSVDTTNKSQSPYKIVDGKPATDEKGNLYTNDVRDDKGYSITTHYHNVANNYNVTSTEGHVKVTKAKLQVKVGDVSTTYGTAFDMSKYTYSYADGIVNGDTAESLNTSLSNKLGLLPGQYVNTAARDGEDGVWTADAGDGYTISLKSKNGRNFFDYYLKNYDTEVLAGNATVEKANLVVKVDDAKTVYGTPFGEKKYDYFYSTETGKNLVNGDTKDSLATGLGTIKYYNDAALDGTTTGRWTKDVGDNYLLKFTDGTKGAFNALNNYNVSFVDGKAKVTPALLVIGTKGFTATYGAVDAVKAGLKDAGTLTGLTNGDENDFASIVNGTSAALSEDGNHTNHAGSYVINAEVGKDLKSVLDTNYTVEYKLEDAVITPYTIKEKEVINPDGTPLYTTVYGTKKDLGSAKFTGVNGEGDMDLAITKTDALTGADTGRLTNNVGDKYYTIVTLNKDQAKDYQFEGNATSKKFADTAGVTPAALTIGTKGFTATYGDVDAVKAGLKDAGTLTGLTNGDEIKFSSTVDGTSNALVEGGTKTNHVGDYDVDAVIGTDLQGVLNKNYKVEYETGKATITPYTIKDQEVVNLDGSPLYTTKYGQKDAFGTATFTGVNGDGTYELAITDSSALATAGAGKVTKDVGKNIYDTSVELSEAMNGNYQFADGATSKTFEKTASVTPAELTIKTKDVETEYGTVKTTTSEVEGLVNGDLPTGFIYDYGNYGGAYLDGNTKTNDVNTYHFGTKLSGAEFLKNYTITGGEADVKIDPKDVTFFVSGTGNTLADVTYTVDPNIDAQLAYGEHVDADYTPGNDLGSNQYGVVAHINGTPIVTGDVAGNYRYNYGGLITLSPTVPTKPDIDPHNPSNLDGSGSWTSNMGNHGVPGVERVAGLASAELPFFKVEAGQVSHYGTYDVAADPDKVRLEPTGKRLPEPNQPKTQYREYTKALTTTDGMGMFRMVYDGSTFNITPVDDGALALMRMGDVKNNVELSAEALHAGFSEMGILLEDLDGVYVHFDTMA